MENKHKYENALPYAASSTTTELEEERERGEITVRTGSETRNNGSEGVKELYVHSTSTR